MLGLLHRSTKHALRLSIAYAHEPTQNALRAEDTRIKRRAVSRDSQGQTRLALRPEDSQKQKQRADISQWGSQKHYECNANMSGQVMSRLEDPFICAFFTCERNDLLEGNAFM